MSAGWGGGGWGTGLFVGGAGGAPPILIIPVAGTPLNLFTRHMGSSQGRIVPINNPTSDGSFDFILGDDLPLQIGQLAIGDKVEVSETRDCTGVNFVRGSLYLRKPTTTMPTGTAWKFSILVDGTEQISTIISRSRPRNALVANVSKLSGPHQITYRLVLAAA